MPTTAMGYASDLTDAQWQVLEPLLSNKRKDMRGRPMKGGLRKRIDGILYVNKTGCQWRQVPHEFGHWLTLYFTFRRMRQRDVWEEVLRHLRQRARVKAGKNKEPSVAIIDSQSAKTALKGGSGGMMRARKPRVASVI